MKYPFHGLAFIFFCGIILLSSIAEQSDGILIISGYALAFGSYALILKKYALQWRQLLILGIVLRLICFIQLPALSDDYYRFIWDGYLVNHGMDPFAYLPSEINIQSDFLRRLIDSLNSVDYYSVYPPTLQYIFGIMQWIGGESVFLSVTVLRIIYFLAEIATLYLGLKLLNIFQLPIENILWYWLNPLVIIEIVGNVHPEGLVIPFVLLAIYLLSMKQFFFSGLSWGVAVTLKLNPIILFLPFLRYFKSRVLQFIGVIIPLLLMTTGFLYFGSIKGFINSLELYFRTFEFNASIYYVFREIGIFFTGYNPINSLGPLLSFFYILIAISLLLKNRDRRYIISITGLSIILWMVYLFLSTTIHPWYLLPIIGLSMLTQMKSPLIWSAVIPLSYMHYYNGSFQENYYLIFLEYSIVFIAFYIDLKNKDYVYKPIN